MKKSTTIVAICLLMQAFAFSQGSSGWVNSQDPAFRRGSPFEFIQVNNTVFASAGLAIYKFDNAEENWVYAGDNLIDKFPYNYIEQFFVYEDHLYAALRNTIMRYDDLNNTWTEQPYTIPENIPDDTNVHRLGATEQFVYAVVSYTINDEPVVQLYYSTDFETWNAGLIQTDMGLIDFRLKLNRHHVAWVSTDNYVQYSSDAINIDTLEFEELPLLASPDQWSEYLCAETMGNNLFYRAPDSKIYRYNLISQIWDCISDNFTDPLNVIGMACDDELLVITAVGGTGLSLIRSTDAGDTYQSLTGNYGNLPFVTRVCRQAESHYWFSNITSDMIFSDNYGLAADFRNQGFNSSLTYVEKFDNKVYSFVTGYGVFKADPVSMIFEPDNTGTEPLLGMYASDGLFAAGSRLYYSYIENITNGQMGLYYKDAHDDVWTKFDELPGLIGLRFLGYDGLGNIYVIASQQLDKAVTKSFYRISQFPSLTNISDNYPGFSPGTNYHILSSPENLLFFFFVDHTGLAKLFKSDDFGATWSDLELDYPTFTYVEEIKKLGLESKALASFDGAGNLQIFMRTIFGLPVNYENIVVNYNPNLDVFSVVTSSGFPQDMVYAGLLSYYANNNQYKLFTPYGIYTTGDFASWQQTDGVEEFDLRPGMIANACVFFDNRAVLSTFCHGLWHTEYYYGLADNPLLNMSLYPNPVNDVLFVENLSPNQSYEIYSITGCLIKTGFAQDGKTTIDVSGLPSGIYSLRSNQNNKEVSVRFIIF